MYESSVILWLVLAILTAFIAAKKNRSFISWLIIGLIIPVVGLIMILVLPEGESLNNSKGEAKQTKAATA